MQCTHPMKLPDRLGGIVVPCNVCLACRIARATEWNVRLAHELSYWPKSAFITLTYDSEQLPIDRSLSKKHVQDFLKRLRERLSGERIVYYAVGEYGDNSSAPVPRAHAGAAGESEQCASGAMLREAQRAGPTKGRPHYHMIIFGIEKCDNCYSCLAQRRGADKPGRGCAHVRNAWKMGNVFLGNVERESIQYVTDYIQKKLYGNVAKLDPREQPFSLMSNGIGKRWCLDNADMLRDRLEFTLYGVKHSIPKYYARLLDIPDEQLAEKAWIAKKEKLEKVSYGISNERAISVLRSDNIRREKDLEARSKLWKKGRL